MAKRGGAGGSGKEAQGAEVTVGLGKVDEREVEEDNQVKGMHRTGAC